MQGYLAFRGSVFGTTFVTRDLGCFLLGGHFKWKPILGGIIKQCEYMIDMIVLRNFLNI